MFGSKNVSKSSSYLLEAKRGLLESDDAITRPKKHKDSSSDDYSRKTSKRKKKEKKSKKQKKSKKKHKSRSSSESTSDSDSDGWVEKNPEVVKPLERDDWMTTSKAFATFTRQDLKPDTEKEKKDKGNIDAYIPSQSTRELNPYWKDGGTGLPSNEKNNERERISNPAKDSRYGETSLSSKNLGFKKPSYRDDYDSTPRHHSDRDKYRYKTSEHKSPYERSSKKNWQRKDDDHNDKDNSRYSPIREKKNQEPHKEEKVETLTLSKESKAIKSTEINYYLTDDELNSLEAKKVKASILGDEELYAQLSAKADAARAYRNEHPEDNPKASGSRENSVMLTMTDEKGNIRPLRKSAHVGDARSKGGKKKMETHSTDGDRIRYFADDDKYSLKEMFEREKFESANASQEQFVKVISKHKNPKDDLEDIFAENITKNISDAKSDEHNMNKAISQHKSMQRSLESCNRCFQSHNMKPQLIISRTDKVYLSVPRKTSLVENHCTISTLAHIQCSTYADEDVWSDILVYRKKLTALFNARNEDVVFFETAKYLNKHPHMLINCIPLPRDVGDTAPIYFKKALLECEAEWSNNKKVVDLKGKDIRRGIPKGLPYFWIDFGMDPGFAHVIEDQQLFPNNFAQEIIGGMLDLDHRKWRKPHEDLSADQMNKVLKFSNMWTNYYPDEKIMHGRKE